MNVPVAVQLIDALCREDFATFVQKCFATLLPSEHFQANWHIHAIAHELSRLRGDAGVRLVINLPPRSLKSIIASVALPAWLIGHDPTLKVICVSYSEDLARKHARDFRVVVESPWFQRMFPAMRLNPRKISETEITTTRLGHRLATSIGGTLTGRGGSLIIIDDPIKPGEIVSETERNKLNDWFGTTLFSRLDNKETGSILVVMQRLHQNDLCGHLDEIRGYRFLRIPAIATEDQTFDLGDGRTHTFREGEILHPARESAETLDQIRRQLGSAMFNAQYLQTPVLPDGTVFKRDWLARYEVFEPKDSAEVIHSWDTASKIGQGNDYTVCTTWAISGPHYHLLHVLRGRWEFPQLQRLIIEHAHFWKARTVLVEDANSGTALLQSLRHAGSHALNILGFKPRLEKETRAAQQATAFEAGRVLLPKDAAWLAAYETELLGFPNARHDDQVDSTTQFLAWAIPRRSHIIAGPIRC